MPFFVAATAKSALLLGATVGIAAAVLSNDRVIEIASKALQKGVDYLNDQMKDKRVKVTNGAVCGEYVPYVDRASVGEISEATTPDVTDDEYAESDEETELGYEDAEYLQANTSGFEKRLEDQLSIHSLD